MREALTTCKRCYNQIAPDTNLLPISVSLLGNMGFYAVELKEYDRALKYLQQVIPIAEKLGQEGTVLKARDSLIRLYEETDNFMMAVEQHELQMELLWKRHEFVEILDHLRQAVKLLSSHKHVLQAKEL